MEFLVKDLMVLGEHHISFAAKLQLNLLSSAKACYVDGTSKVVRQPFHQLFTIHAFAKNNDKAFQFPFMFCFITARITADYVAVLNALKTVYFRAYNLSHHVGL